MAVTVIWGTSAGAGSEDFSAAFDYDDAAQAIGLTCTGAGHAEFLLTQVSNGQLLGAGWADQFGQTSGTIRSTPTPPGNLGNEGTGDAGQSTGAVAYDATRHIILGPGAAGIDAAGTPLSTRKVAASVVAQVTPPKGQTATLAINFYWKP